VGGQLPEEFRAWKSKTLQEWKADGSACPDCNGAGGDYALRGTCDFGVYDEWNVCFACNGKGVANAMTIRRHFRPDRIRINRRQYALCQAVNNEYDKVRVKRASQIAALQQSDPGLLAPTEWSIVYLKIA
jgi:hypothetical protein